MVNTAIRLENFAMRCNPKMPVRIWYLTTLSMLSTANQVNVWCIVEVGPRSTLNAMHYSTTLPVHFQTIKRAFLNHRKSSTLAGWSDCSLTVTVQ